MRTLLTRREALGAALGSAAFGCRSENRSAPSPALSAPARPSTASSAAGDLEVLHVTNMSRTERGGHVVVLLHGYGAPGDDLASLAKSLLRPRTRFVLPAAPLALGNGGRAWWGSTAIVLATSLTRARTRSQPRRRRWMQRAPRCSGCWPARSTILLPIRCR